MQLSEKLLTNNKGGGLIFFSKDTKNCVTSII